VDIGEPAGTWIDLCGGGGDAANLYDYRSNLLAGTDADSPALDK